MSTFRERLQQAAYFAGVGTTQASIAGALGLNRQTINRWFLGGEPSAENLLDISRKWGVSAEWLQSGDGEMLPKPATTDALNTEERELLRSYRSATPQTRQLLRTMARAARKSVLFLAATIPPLLSPSNVEAGNVCAIDAPVYYVKWRRLLRALQAFLTAECHVQLAFRT